MTITELSSAVLETVRDCRPRLDLLSQASLTRPSQLCEILAGRRPLQAKGGKSADPFNFRESSASALQTQDGPSSLSSSSWSALEGAGTVARALYGRELFVQQHKRYRLIIPWVLVSYHYVYPPFPQTW